MTTSDVFGAGRPALGASGGAGGARLGGYGGSDGGGKGAVALMTPSSSEELSVMMVMTSGATLRRSSKPRKMAPKSAANDAVGDGAPSSDASWYSFADVEK